VPSWNGSASAATGDISNNDEPFALYILDWVSGSLT